MSSYQSAYGTSRLVEATEREFYNPILAKIASQILDSIVNSTSDATKRRELDELMLIGSGLSGVVYNPSNTTYAPLYAIKQAKTTRMASYLKNDFAMGAELNKLRDRQNIFNFVYYYNLFDCGDSAIIEGTQTLGWCSTNDPRYRLPFIAMERVPNAVTMADFIMTREFTPEIFSSIFLQILFALSVASDTMNFLHSDLHSSNVLIRMLDRPVNLVYQYGCSTVAVKTDYLAVIIDYDRATTGLTKNGAVADVYLFLFAVYDRLTGKKQITATEKRTVRVLTDLLQSYMRVHDNLTARTSSGPSKQTKRTDRDVEPSDEKETTLFSRLNLLRSSRVQTPPIVQEYRKLLKRLAYIDRTDTTLTVHDLVDIQEGSLKRAGSDLSYVLSKIEETDGPIASCDALRCSTEEQIVDNPAVTYFRLVDDGIKRSLLSEQEESELYDNTNKYIQELEHSANDLVKSLEKQNANNLVKRLKDPPKTPTLIIVFLKEAIELFANNIRLWKITEELKALTTSISAVAINKEEFDLIKSLNDLFAQIDKYFTSYSTLEQLAALLAGLIHRPDVNTLLSKDRPLFDFYDYGINVALSILSDR